MIKHGSYKGYVKGRCRCGECKAWKVTDNLRTVELSRGREISHGTGSGYRYGCRCSDCKEAKKRENSVMNPRRDQEVRSPRSLKKPKSKIEYAIAKYNLSLDEYNSTLKEQDGLCALCFGPPDDERLYVDHCHVTGRVRGLLCRRCNLTLGFARDDPELLRRMAIYVE